MKSLFVAVAAVMFALPVTLPAQRASAAAREFFNASTKQDYAAMAGMIDSAAFKLVREKADEIVEQISDRNAGTGGDPARAAALSGMMDRLMSTMIATTFARTKTVDELKQLNDNDLMMRWLEAKSARYQAGNVGDLLGGLGGLAGLAGLTGGAMPPGAQRELDSVAAALSSIVIDWAIVGEVAEGSSLAHITYRAAGFTPAATTGVLTFKLIVGRWKLQVNSLEDGEQLTVMSELEALALQAKAG